MMGVVLWKNPSDGSAVIWCDDHGDLAFLNNPHHDLDQFSYFEVGDMVEFDVTVQEDLRQVKNLSRVDDLCHPELVKTLAPDNATEQANDPAGKSAKILPFRQNLDKPDPDQQAG